jgi:Sushi repeat (SCR repeat)
VYAQLQSQIVRRKRDTDDDNKDDDASTASGRRNQKNRGPCEPLLNIEHMQVEVVKPPKNQNESFGHGMVLKITCDTGYNSNVQTANSTVRCNKGVWKPVKPICNLSELDFLKIFYYVKC